MKRLLIASVVIAVLAPGFALPTSAAEPEPDHVVHVGAVDPRGRTSIYLFQDYYPRHLQVHRGDHVRWTFPNQATVDQAFHTVTFADPDETPWVRPSEVPGTFAFDERSFFSSGCGRANQPVCVISSTDQFVSSGTPVQHSSGAGTIEPFDAVIDLPEGTYGYFCTIHHPAMQGTVEVVADNVQLANPSPEDSADRIRALAERADADFAAMSRPTPVIEDARRVWTVWAGGLAGDDGPIAFDAFLPGSLEIRAGDTVRWVTDADTHGVTFPDPGPRPGFFTFDCDPDSPDAGAPAVPIIGTLPFAVAGMPFCPPGWNFEMNLTELGAKPIRAPGDAVVSRFTLHNSGIMVTPDLPERIRGVPPASGNHFPSEFEATFPVPGTYTYRCLIHFGFMTGSIKVEGG